MRKIDEGTFSLDGSSESYYIQLFEVIKNKVYACKAFDKKGIFKNLIGEKSFHTIMPDFESMVHSILVDIELSAKHERKQIENLSKFKLSGLE